MLSVTEVDVAPNLAAAKVYISVFPPDKTDAALRLLNAKTLRTALAQRTRKQMRTVPELNFIVDTTLNYAHNIEKMLKKI